MKKSYTNVRWSRAMRIHSTAYRTSLHSDDAQGGRRERQRFVPPTRARRRYEMKHSSHISLDVFFFNSKTTADISKWYKTFSFPLIHSLIPSMSAMRHKIRRHGSVFTLSWRETLSSSPLHKSTINIYIIKSFKSLGVTSSWSKCDHYDILSDVSIRVKNNNNNNNNLHY